MAKNSTISIGFTLSDDANGLKRLTMDAEEFRKVMQETVKVSEGLKNKFINFASIATGFRSGADSLNQMIGVLDSVTSESDTFNTAMREANTMAGKDNAGFKALKGDVAALAREIPIARDELANGLYQTISNGVPEDNWIDYLNASARSAVGGLADINDVVGVTATVIKNYGLEWEAAASTQDKIQLAAKLGKTAFGELAQSLPRVTGNAATLGVSIEELLGSFATLTGVSGNTAEASTQLAAIFTALVKPSSEAAKMAAEMGIQFDAAAIKAAGGFQNFLTQLDKSVKAYSQATGTLEQEVYGRLFGSAESLRALIPLQGELADKFTANVAAMTDSAGTMDAAFAEMSSTGEATSQMIRNQLAAIGDLVAGVTSWLKPYLGLAQGFLSTGASAAILYNGIKSLNLAHKAHVKIVHITRATVKLLRNGYDKLLQTLHALCTAMKSSVQQAGILKTALRGLLVASAIGVAIWGLTTIIGHFTKATGDAADSANELAEAEDAYIEAAGAAQVQIDKDIQALGELIKAKKDTAGAVAHLNKTYGDIFGTYKTAAEWLDVLTQKSKDYVKYMGYAAQIDVVTRRRGNWQTKKDVAEEKMAELEKTGKARRTETLYHVAPGAPSSSATSYTKAFETEEYIQAKKDKTEAEKKLAEYDKQLDVIFKKEEELKKKGINLPGTENHFPTTTNPTSSSQDVAKELDENASTLRGYEDNIQVLQAKLLDASMKEAEQINKDIDKWQEKADAIRGAGRAVEETPLPIGEVKTYEQLNRDLSIYERQMEKADATRRVTIQKSINELRKLKDAWDDARDAAEKPGDISTLDTIGKLGSAISYYQKRQSDATGDDIQNNQRSINALEKKRSAIQRIADLQSDIDEANEINKLTGREYKVKISSMGFEELTSKIKDLNRMLDNQDLTESQRKDIESLISVYEKWRKEGLDTFAAVRNAWGSAKDIGSGVESITNALEGNGNAWQRITGIVDGFLQVYDGVKSIIDIINMFSVATKVQTAVKTEETNATREDTTELMTNTAATLTNMSAKQGEAVAEATAQGAKLPFPANLAAIAAAVAAVLSALSVIGSFATGGIVGGNSPSGDRLLARVNSGEMILNSRQQKRLFDLLNSNAVARTVSVPRLQMPEITFNADRMHRLIQPNDGGYKTISVEIEGRKLRALLERENNFRNRS